MSELFLCFFYSLMIDFMFNLPNTHTLTSFFSFSSVFNFSFIHFLFRFISPSLYQSIYLFYISIFLSAPFYFLPTLFFPLSLLLYLSNSHLFFFFMFQFLYLSSPPLLSPLSLPLFFVYSLSLHSFLFCFLIFISFLFLLPFQVTYVAVACP